MCKIGDIIVVDRYIGDNGSTISKHSFVVINDDSGKIEGLYYDLIESNIKHKIRFPYKKFGT